MMRARPERESRLVLWVIVAVVLIAVFVVAKNHNVASSPSDSLSQQSSGSQGTPFSSVVQVKGIDGDSVTKFCDGSTLVYTALDVSNRDGSLASQVQVNSPQCATDSSSGNPGSPTPPWYENTATKVKEVSDKVRVLYKVFKLCDGANLLYITLEEYGTISLQLIPESASCKA